jgi:predicted Zn-dependent protease
MPFCKHRISKIFFAAAFAVCPASFADDYESIVVDDEISLFLSDIVCKIKHALGYESDIKVYVTDNRVLNAYASQDGVIVVNAGAIMQCENVEEIIAILAHETAHIAGRHLSTIIANVPNCIRAGLVIALIGAAAGIIAKNPDPCFAGVIGGDSVASHMSISKLRQKEGTADTKAAQAIRKLGWPVFGGFISIHRKLGSSPAIFSKYLLTHPLQEERMEKFREYYMEDKKRSFPKETIEFLSKLQTKFDVIKLKLQALVNNPRDFIEVHKSPKSDEEAYAISIAMYRLGQYDAAIKIVNIIMEAPKSSIDKTHCSEILAMCLINTKKFKEAADTAWSALSSQKETKYRDLTMIYADSVIEGKLLGKHMDNAIKLLRKMALKRDDPLATHLLGKLYAINGMDCEASLCAAEAFLLEGDKRMALIHAKRASSYSKNKIIKRKAEDIMFACREEQK